MNKNYSGCKALIMGLGLHGGGVESARYLVRHGATVTVTDMRDAGMLAPSITELEGLPIRYVLGGHNISDFKRADIVVKNPGVRPDSPFLQAAGRVETDISLFLAQSPAQLIAVTGSKGKSGTASALHWVLNEVRQRGMAPGTAYLGGNIAVSPLSFVDELSCADDVVVLELSSWQLSDLRGRADFKPRAAVITAILPDHLNWYDSMEQYVNDKRVIYQGQDELDCTVAGDDAWGRSFLRESRGRPLVYASEPVPRERAGAWLAGEQGLAHRAGQETVEIVPAAGVLVPGIHQKKNLLAAGLALLDLCIAPDCIADAFGRFPGIEHRLEFFHKAGGVLFYNDSAATIPEAAAAAVAAFASIERTGKKVVLVTGGTDKALDFSPLASAAAVAKAVVVLAGTGTDKLLPLLNAAGTEYQGPFSVLDEAVTAAVAVAAPGDVVVLSPGCASFGMFLNEFDRGRQWKEAVYRFREKEGK
jgi:UDP-N-acetylmuramoylalanine--D-glutamate ligase